MNMKAIDMIRSDIFSVCVLYAAHVFIIAIKDVYDKY